MTLTHSWFSVMPELGRDGAAVAVFAPHYPLPREEKWFLFVADPLTNEVISAVEHVSLLEAEYLGAQAAKVGICTGFSTVQSDCVVK